MLSIRICKNCPNETKNPVFCSRSCAATFNNTKFPKRRSLRTIHYNCVDCNKQTKNTSSPRCWTCYQDKKSILRKNKIQDWINGTWNAAGFKNKYQLSTIIHDYLIQQSEGICSKCGFDKIHPVDNKTILEVNHIDGNPYNHSPTNLEVICPNCHALTPNYRARNTGKGRPTRYDWKKAHETN